MSRWAEQFKNHPLHGLWSQLAEMLKGPFGDVDEDPLLKDELIEIARARKALEYIRGILDNLDPEILGPSYLDNLIPYTQQCIVEISNFNTNGRVGHLHNLNSNIDQLIVLSSQSPFQAFGHVKTNLTKAANLYAETMSGIAGSYASVVTDLKLGIEEQGKQLKLELNSSESALKLLQEKMASIDGSVQAQLSSFNTTFQASEITRTQSYETWQINHQSKADNEYARFTKEISSALLTLLSFKDDAEKVLGTVIDTAQAGAYAKYANEEKKSADGYRRFAIISMIAAALVLFAPEFFHWIKEASRYDIDWQRALYRLPFSAILLGPAIYLAKESSSHRANEILNRRRQHILTTISPYLALLDKDRADGIKAEVAKNLFSDNPANTDDKSIDMNSMALKMADVFLAIAKKK
ncbi:hypothetical protein [Xanthomonas euvesicatoria]|uniref:hypothetical protein n=1 Tax=Xanthomonas euvesicatoria TaxID=456327 RepID=UPI001C48B100|nr:hypothetical protein [Xanthomonas euvesicatoria]MBV6799737.1 hypothetical protein [Xanthomonas campestris pv. obscurae]